MYFIDFEQMKTYMFDSENEYSLTYEFSFDKFNKKELAEKIGAINFSTEHPMTFIINYTDDNGNIDDFTSTVNSTVAVIFAAITTDKARTRERRLNVPANLIQEVHCSLGQLKKALNYQTLVNQLNIIVHNENYHYLLVDGKEDK